LTDTTVTFTATTQTESEFGTKIKARSDRGLTELGVRRANSDWLPVPNLPEEVGEPFASVAHGAKFRLNIYLNIRLCKTLGNIAQALHHELAVHAMLLGDLVRTFEANPGRSLRDVLAGGIIPPQQEHATWKARQNALYERLRGAFLAACADSPALAQVATDYESWESADMDHF
jgi:hypothetical protein